jgi:hypothetical protein
MTGVGVQVMKRVWLASMVLIAQLAGQASWAGACVEPAPFGDDIPSGASATRDSMLSTQRAIKAYDIAVKAYADCLRDSGDSSNRGNLAIQSLEKLASRFNDQLKLFKERNGAT